MPSFREPFRNILLGAMATRTPNVATWNDSALHLLGGEISIFVDKASPNVLSSGNSETINNSEAAFERSKDALG